MAEAAVLVLPLSEPETTPRQRWFSSIGCVVEHDDHFEVFIAGQLLGQYERDDRVGRDTLLMLFATAPDAHYEKLSAAFGITSETLRRLRRLYDRKGLAAVLGRPKQGGQEILTAKQRARVVEAFEQGLSIRQAREQLRIKASMATVGQIHRQWVLDKQASEAATEPPTELALVPEPEAGQQSLAFELASEPSRPTLAVVSSDDEGDEEDEPGEPRSPREIGARGLRSTKGVQHVGSLLLVALLASWGIYEDAREVAPKKLGKDALRIAIDALTISLALGQRCVEGVRRLATPTVETLLRADRCPSPAWVRTTLGHAARDGGAGLFHYSVARKVATQAQASSEGPTVFYIDNHLRPYSGKKVVRKGWRMQDRRVVPGVSDYYVHDEDGRPVMKLDAPEHGSLTQWLPPLARMLRLMLGLDSELLLAFDRGGAFVDHLVELRNAGYSFVTYERKPYPMLAVSAFTEEFVDDDDEKVGVHDSRTNLRKGRGRLRRISLRMSDGSQVNLLTNSTLPAESLYRIMRGRWRQENGFKHGNERWGINQLDGRRTEPYPPDAVIPNPARRRLDHALRLARRREGELRCQLARLGDDDGKRAMLEEQLAEATEQIEQLEEQRPHVPKKAPVARTELANELVRHTGELKRFIDTIRVACANAESELALCLARGLPRPTEAKKVLANLLVAPGDLRVGRTRITITLAPAGTTREREAMRQLLEEVSRWSLSLPGDEARRSLTFRVQ